MLLANPRPSVGRKSSKRKKKRKKNRRQRGQSGEKRWKGRRATRSFPWSSTAGLVRGRRRCPSEPFGARLFVGHESRPWRPGSHPTGPLGHPALHVMDAWAAEFANQSGPIGLGWSSARRAHKAACWNIWRIQWGHEGEETSSKSILNLLTTVVRPPHNKQLASLTGRVAADDDAHTACNT